MKRYGKYAALAAGLSSCVYLGFAEVKDAPLPSREVPKEHVYLFPGLRGPQAPSEIPRPAKTPWQKYGRGSPSRLAVLLLDQEAPWLGIARGLKSFGIPFRIHADFREALKHDVVLLYEGRSGAGLARGELEALESFLQRGGTLIGVNVHSGALGALFGFNAALPSTRRKLFYLRGRSPLLEEFIDPAERTISLGDVRHPRAAIETYGYVGAGPALMAGQDGTAFLIERNAGRGRAFALGVDLGRLANQSYNVSKDFNAQRIYVNGYEPSLDVLFRTLQRIYLGFAQAPVLLQTVPFGKPLAVCITHDLDYGISLANAVQYAQYEKSAGIKATYFVQTKYVRDWSDAAFYTRENLKYLQRVQDLGMEIASHSVSHSGTFMNFPLGSGREEYPAYTPFVGEYNTTYNGSILGELRVSKFLLESLLPRQRVVSFRSGHLIYPAALPEALEATGYLYSSCVTADNVLSHLPYRLQYNMGSDQEMDLFEFPISIEDEARPIMTRRLSGALKLADRLSRYGGFINVLIHPNILEYKFEFEKSFVKALRPKAFFSSLREFGGWWRARDGVEVDVFSRGASRVIRLKAAEPIAGLTLRVPAGWRCAHAGEEGNVSQTGGSVIIRRLAGTMELPLIRP